MKCKIPQNIHLFWGSCYLPEDALHNIISFAQHTNDSWKIILWTDNIKHITDSPIFKSSKEYALPLRVEIRTINNLLDLGVDKLNQHYKEIKNEYICIVPSAGVINLIGKIQEIFPGDSFYFLKTFINQLITGLSVPAAAKDCILPLAIYCFGGYAFDLDAKAISTITPFEAKHGLFIMNQGIIAAGLAMTPNHKLAIYSFLRLRQWLTQKPFDFEPLNKKMTFFNLDKIKNRTNDSRARLICQTTGSAFRAGFNLYCNQNNKRIGDTNDLRFVIETAFPVRNDAHIIMGIKFDLTSDKSLWRKSKNPKYSYDLDNSDLYISKTSQQVKL